MAVKSAKTELILEEAFSCLYEAGVPISVCVHLQENGLALGGAVWTAKQSKTGFSVCFYWKTSSGSDSKPKKSKRRKHYKKTEDKKPTLPAQVPSEIVKAKELGKTSKATADPPIDAHLMKHAAAGDEQSPVSAATEYESGADIIDLVACNDVTYEAKDDVPGVKFVEGDDEKWTPVKRRKKRKKNKVEVADSDCDIDMNMAKQVIYEERNGVPGLYIRRKCMSAGVSPWTPVKPSYIANRTRSKLK